MDSRCLVFAFVLIATLSAGKENSTAATKQLVKRAVYAEPIEKVRQRRALWGVPGLYNLEEQQAERAEQKRAKSVNLDNLEDVNEKDLKELEDEVEDALETRDEMKRGIFTCRKLFNKCNWFKHCCGTLKCSRKGVQYSGICLKYV